MRCKRRKIEPRIRRDDCPNCGRDVEAMARASDWLTCPHCGYEWIPQLVHRDPMFSETPGRAQSTAPD